jgi:hypothetical protein
VTSALSGYDFKFLDFKGLSGESDEWITFDRTSLIVGRNNVGKSALVHALTFAVDQKQTFNPEWHRHGQNARYLLRQLFTEKELRRAFPENTSGGSIPGDHWEFGKSLVGAMVSREFDAQRGQKWIDEPNLDRVSPNGRAGVLAELSKVTTFPNVRVFGVSAERDVVPEPPNTATVVKSGGEGLTNLVRAFLHDSSLPMDEIEIGLLQDLNWVFETSTQSARPRS